MLDEETYKKELVRMWDSLREYCKRYGDCSGVKCEECPLHETGCVNPTGCGNPTKRVQMIDMFKIINVVEKWSKEHPPKKYKVSRMEYDLLQTVINFGSSVDTFNDFCTLSGLLEKGYFEGATGSMCISDYYNNCEVEDNDD